jgi:hypothetical protein
MAYFKTPEEVLDYVHDLLDDESGDLGLEYVAYGEEDKIPRMPAVKVASGPLVKDLHATRQYINTFVIEMFVYHANLRATHAQRTKDDLELCTRIRELLHSHPTFDGGVIQGWVISEVPMLTTRQKAPAVVTTNMTWQGNALESFSM